MIPFPPMQRLPSSMTTHRISVAVAAAVLFLVALGCGKFTHATPDAGSVEAPVADNPADAAVDLDAMLAMLGTSNPFVAPNDSGCPAAVRPGYCRRACRTWASRQMTKHARRVSAPVRHAFGTCGPFKVFAEDDKSGAGVVEYYDPGGTLVGAVDRRQKPCGQYGLIPACKPELKWENVAGATPDASADDEDDPF